MSSDTKQQNPPTENETAIAYWMGKVDATLLELRSLIEQWGKTDAARWSDQKVWCDRADERIQNHEERLQRLEANGVKLAQDESESHITWRWLVEKLIAPIVTAGVIWFLLTVLPQYFSAHPAPY